MRAGGRNGGESPQRRSHALSTFNTPVSWVVGSALDFRRFGGERLIYGNASRIIRNYLASRDRP